MPIERTTYKDHVIKYIYALLIFLSLITLNYVVEYIVCYTHMLLSTCVYT